jgi:hypothetical protein
MLLRKISAAAVSPSAMLSAKVMKWCAALPLMSKCYKSSKISAVAGVLPATSQLTMLQSIVFADAVDERAGALGCCRIEKIGPDCGSWMNAEQNDQKRCHREPPPTPVMPTRTPTPNPEIE